MISTEAASAFAVAGPKTVSESSLHRYAESKSAAAAAASAPIASSVTACWASSGTRPARNRHILSTINVTANTDRDQRKFTIIKTLADASVNAGATARPIAAKNAPSTPASIEGVCTPAAKAATVVPRRPHQGDTFKCRSQTSLRSASRLWRLRPLFQRAALLQLLTACNAVEKLLVNASILVPNACPFPCCRTAVRAVAWHPFATAAVMRIRVADAAVTTDICSYLPWHHMSSTKTHMCGDCQQLDLHDAVLQCRNCLALQEAVPRRLGEELRNRGEPSSPTAAQPNVNLKLPVLAQPVAAAELRAKTRRDNNCCRKHTATLGGEWLCGGLKGHCIGSSALNCSGQHSKYPALHIRRPKNLPLTEAKLHSTRRPVVSWLLHMETVHIGAARCVYSKAIYSRPLSHASSVDFSGSANDGSVRIRGAKVRPVCSVCASSTYGSGWSRASDGDVPDVPARSSDYYNITIVKSTARENSRGDYNKSGIEKDAGKGTRILLSPQKEKGLSRTFQFFPSCLRAKRPRAKAEKRARNYQRAYEEKQRREQQQVIQQQRKQLLEQQEEAEPQRAQQQRLSGKQENAEERDSATGGSATLTQLMEEARVASGEVVKHSENFVVVGSTQRHVHGRRPPNTQRYEKQQEFVMSVFDQLPITEEELQTEMLKAQRAWRGDMMLDELEAEIGGPDALAPGGIRALAR